MIWVERGGVFVKRNMMKLGVVALLSMGVLAGCGVEEEQPQEFMTNTVTPDDLAVDTAEGSSDKDVVQGWARVGTQILDDGEQYRYEFSGFIDDDTFTISKINPAYTVTPYYYKAVEGMEVAIGTNDVSITLLKSDPENNRIEVSLEQKK